MKKACETWSLYLLGLAVLAGCSDVSFDSVPLPEGRLDLSRPGVFINQDAEFTNKLDVDLLLAGGFKPLQMKISNSPTCEDGAWEPFKAQKKWRLSADNQSVAVYARYRQAGGFESDCVTDSIVHDDRPPEVRILNPANWKTKESSLFAEFESSDSGSGLQQSECAFGPRGGYFVCETGWVIGGLNEGIHRLRVRSRDRAGNVSVETPYQWIVDHTPPRLSWTVLPKALSNETQQEAGFLATDQLTSVSQIECQDAPDTAWTTCQSPRKMVRGDGTHTLKVRARDEVGNVSEAISAHWQIDTVPPAVELVKVPAALSKETDLSAEFIGRDAHSGVDTYECLTGTGEFVACRSPYLKADLTEGRQELRVRVKDLAGNWSIPAVHNWTTDFTPPEIQITDLPVDTLVGDRTKVGFTAKDTVSGVASVECRLNQSTIPCVAGLSLDILAERSGRQVFEVVVTDRVGHMARAELNWRQLLKVHEKNQAHRVNESRPVDVLFVVDNSISMNYERSNLAARISGFLEKIIDLDWQIGVITTDALTGNVALRDGKFVELKGTKGQYLLNPSFGMAQAQKLLGDTVESLPEGHGFEQGIHTTYRAIQRAFQKDNRKENEPNRNFFRNGAHLSVVLISDEDETPEKNHMNSPEQFLNFVNQSWNGTKEVVWHSIINLPDDKVCLDGEGEAYGPTYMRLSELTKGVIGSVCEADYTKMLSNIGDRVRDLQRAVALECSPADRDSDGVPEVKVFYRANANGVFAPYLDTFVLDGAKLTFKELLKIGEYRFDYGCL